MNGGVRPENIEDFEKQFVAYLNEKCYYLI